jgi:hypothetical protein
MIPIEQRLIAIVFSLGFLLLTVQLIRKHKLRESYALGWLIAAFLILVLSVFGEIVDALASLFAVTYTPTLILVIGLLAALVILLLQSVVVSTQADRIRDLAQQSALLEWRVRQLEEQQRPIIKPIPGQAKNGNSHETTNSEVPIWSPSRREKDEEELSV